MHLRSQSLAVVGIKIHHVAADFLFAYRADVKPLAMIVSTNVYCGITDFGLFKHLHSRLLNYTAIICFLAVSVNLNIGLLSL
jgi:hypothetical protein